jgi:hypothetical protein
MNTELQEKCQETIKNLCEKYKNNNYILNRINNHINTNLSNTLDNEYKNYEKRIDRNNLLTNEQAIFVQVFLSKNHYYFLSNNNNSSFYEYNGKNYSIIKEDDILFKLLTSISKDKPLAQWKYKTKINIIKKIKERNLFKSIPETFTIQNVLNFLYPSIFSTKNQVKYFLTTIGDNILKKNTDTIFLINQNTKKLLFEIDNIAYVTTGNSNTINNFMTKYHESHNYENCRLIKTNENFCVELFKDKIKTIGLDLLVVATHYSNRHENSDHFIETKADEELKNYTWFLKMNNQNTIIDKFMNQCIEQFENDSKNSENKFTIQWKNMHFVWKQFIHNSTLPNIIYSNTLKGLLREKLEYNEETDTFLNVTSKYLPTILDFTNFWETTIQVVNNENYEDEIEIDEIYLLFKIWSCKNSKSVFSNGNLREKDVLNIIQHFFQNIQILDNKYILNIQCILWDKKSDIQYTLNLLKSQYKFNDDNTNNPLIEFEEAYNFYILYQRQIYDKQTDNLLVIVSKRYFEKYLHAFLTEYIIYDNFISSDWYLNS